MDDDLSGSNNYFFWPLTRFQGCPDGGSERLRTIAPSRLVSVRAQYVGVGIVSINAVQCESESKGMASSIQIKLTLI